MSIEVYFCVGGVMIVRDIWKFECGVYIFLGCLDVLIIWLNEGDCGGS